MASGDEVAGLMAFHDLRFAAVDEDEKQRLLDQLSSAASSSSAEGVAYFKVHFTEALDLVRRRQVLVVGGLCYVPETEMRAILGLMFKSLLIQNLALTAKTLPNLDEDDRLVRMLSDLDRRYTAGGSGAEGSLFQQDGASVTPEMIRPLSEKSFPLCMRSMQNCLDTSHHLKYKARLQYGLFLKGIGLSMEDAIRFFRGEFTRGGNLGVDPDKFDKEYTYGIRYNYGKEGKKVNWAPWNCMRIIMDNVGPGENHGCPYRHHDPDLLRAALIRAGGNTAPDSEELNLILNAAKEGHFQKACALQFRSAHRGLQELTTGITNHPNQYYHESVNGPGSSSSSSSSTANKLKTERASLYHSAGGTS